MYGNIYYLNVNRIGGILLLEANENTFSKYGG